MSEPVRTPTDKISARRKLLRGSFALPTVLAVHNGSALAARSNRFRCVLHDTPAGGGMTPGLTDNSRDWMRVQRYRAGTTGNYKYYVKVADLSSVATAANISYAGPAGTVGTTETGTGVAYWIPWHASETVGAPATGTVLTLDGSAAVLFNATGTGTSATASVVGFVKENQTTAPAYTGASARSCWTSIK